MKLNFCSPRLPIQCRYGVLEHGPLGDFQNQIVFVQSFYPHPASNSGETEDVNSIVPFLRHELCRTSRLSCGSLHIPF